MTPPLPLIPRAGAAAMPGQAQLCREPVYCGTLPWPARQSGLAARLHHVPLPTAAPAAVGAVPVCPGGPKELVDRGSADGDWGESPVGVALIMAESCAMRSQRGQLPSHDLALCWSAVWPGNPWKDPRLQQQFSPLVTLTDFAGMLSPSETAQTPVYFKKINNDIERIDVNKLS